VNNLYPWAPIGAQGYVLPFSVATRNNAAPHCFLDLVDLGLLRRHVFVVPFLSDLHQVRIEGTAMLCDSNRPHDIFAILVADVGPATF
jgi:hypothetical protein